MLLFNTAIETIYFQIAKSFYVVDSIAHRNEGVMNIHAYFHRSKKLKL